VLTGGAYSAMDFAEAADSVSFALSRNGSTSTTAVAVTKGAGANTLKVTVGSTVTDNITVTSGAAVTGAEMASAISTGLTAANMDVAVSFTTALVFTGGAGDSSTAAVSMTNFAFANGGAGAAITAAQFGFTAGGVGVTAGGTASSRTKTAKMVDHLVSSINNTTALQGKVLASTDNGKLRIQNLSTAELTMGGIGGAGTVTGGANTADVAGNDAGAAVQYVARSAG